MSLSRYKRNELKSAVRLSDEEEVMKNRAICVWPSLLCLINQSYIEFSTMPAKSNKN